VADDPTENDAAPPPSGAPPKDLPAARWSTRRWVLVVLAFFVPVAVIALSIASILRDTGRRGAPAPAVSSVDASPGPQTVASAASPAVASVAAPALSAPATPPEFGEETDDGEPQAAKKAAPKRYASVEQAAAESCTTKSVEKLSRQIIDQARCINKAAFVALPTRANVTLGSSVFPYLEKGTKDRLMRALDANPTKKMTINSALRTVAQQYLVRRWAAGRRCGVQQAMRPGDSNHEIGAALDIAEPDEWRPALEKQGFRWLGKSDRVHFDYPGSGTSSDRLTDVLAFQILWNRNHPSDQIAANGRYSPATEQRLKKAPAEGFPMGPSCGVASSKSR
jgi:hypothetical protein